MADQESSGTLSKPIGSISVNVLKLQSQCLLLVVTSVYAVVEIAMKSVCTGNGDILSFEDYNLKREQSSVAGVMVAR